MTREKVEGAPEWRRTKGLEACREENLITLVIIFEEILSIHSVQYFPQREIYSGMSCHFHNPRVRKAERKGCELKH